LLHNQSLHLRLSQGYKNKKDPRTMLTGLFVDVQI
jgi:hypothetical protein